MCGNIGYVWQYRLCMAILVMYGNIGYVWQYRLCMAILVMWGNIGSVWQYWLCVAISVMYGNIQAPAFFISLARVSFNGLSTVQKAQGVKARVF